MIEYDLLKRSFLVTWEMNVLLYLWVTDPTDLSLSPLSPLSTNATELPSVPSVLTLLTIVKFAQHLLARGSTSSVLTLLTCRSVPQSLARDIQNLLFFPCQYVCLSFPCVNRLSLLLGSVGS
jgi:hypothetical protein